MINSNLPKISFVIPVLNEEKRIRKCLDSIKKQEYDWEKIEVLVVDGGSQDNTLDIIKEYGFNIVKNPYKLGEIGCTIGYELAKEDLVVFMAADNALVQEEWLFNMVMPFTKEENMAGAFCKVDADPKDKEYNGVSRYINLGTDPFNLFVFGREYTYYPWLHKVCKTEKETDTYDIYEFDVKKYPLIALAQGFVVNKRFLGNDILNHWKGDDMLPVIKMIESGWKIAYVKNCCIKHYIFKNLSHFIGKMNRKIQLAFVNPNRWGFQKRENYLSFSRKIRKFLFLPYVLLFFPAFFHSIYWTVKEKKKDLLYHSFAGFVTGILIVKHEIKNFLKL